MSSFISKRILRAKSLGDKLKEARREAGVSLERAARDLNITFKYLEALENNKLTDLPGEPYLKIFLKVYSDYLRLDFNECWAEAKKNGSDAIKGYQKIGRQHFLIWPKFIWRLIICGLVVTVLIFLFFKIQAIFSPPSLEIIAPADGIITSGKQLEIVGRSQPEVEIVINNKEIFVDSQGNFQTAVDLQKGLNLIKITAKKRYSQMREVEIRALFKE